MKIARATERERAIAGVTSALKAYVERGMFVNPEQAKVARDVLAVGDPDKIITMMRQSTLQAYEDAKRAATSDVRARGIYGVYEDAQHSLLVLNHVDWEPNNAVWREIGAFCHEDTLEAMHADGGYRAVHGDHQLQLKYQDFLDPVFQERFFYVRQAFLGPVNSHSRVEKLPINIDGDICTLEIVPRLVGHGKNVAALMYQISKGQLVNAEGVSDRELVVIEDRMNVRQSSIVDFIRNVARDEFANRKLEKAAEALIGGEPADAPEGNDEGTYGTGFRSALSAMSVALLARGIHAETIKESVDEALKVHENYEPSDDDVNDAPRPF